MKTPGRRKTVLSAVVSPSPSAPPSKIRTGSSSQIVRFLPLLAAGMITFRLVDQVQVEPVEVDPLCTHGQGTAGVDQS